MKKAAYIGLFILLASSIILDLQKPHDTYSNINHSTTTYSKYRTSYLIQSGDTVLSIVEKTSESQAIPDSLATIIDDFRILNPDANPYHLIQNKTYDFPVYLNKNRDTGK